jgi:hypothetical protein
LVEREGWIVRWRDIRFEKPTEADADEKGKVLQLLPNGGVVSWPWDGCGDVVAWMPMSELSAFDRVPDPPDGWRFVEKGEAFDERAKFWAGDMWLSTSESSYGEYPTYIVPIDPPKPKYRPFANAAEFEPYRDRWICTHGANTVRRVDHYNDQGVNGMTWESLFRNRTFEDGSPCGVEVTE